MPRFQVVGTYKIDFDVEVTAEDEESAEEIVSEMDPSELLGSHSSYDDVEIEDVVEIPEPPPPPDPNQAKLPGVA